MNNTTLKQAYKTSGDKAREVVSTDFEVSLEYEHTADAEERLLKIFEFLLQDPPVENYFVTQAKVI